jgi:hypothetical protein
MGSPDGGGIVSMLELTGVMIVIGPIELVRPGFKGVVW